MSDKIAEKLKRMLAESSNKESEDLAMKLLNTGKMKQSGNEELFNFVADGIDRDLDDVIKGPAKKIKMPTKALKKVGSKALKGLPIVGGLAALLSSGDVSAALPLLNEAEDLGPEEGTFGRKLEMGEATPEDKSEFDRQQAEELKMQAIQQLSGKSQEELAEQYKEKMASLEDEYDNLEDPDITNQGPESEPERQARINEERYWDILKDK